LFNRAIDNVGRLIPVRVRSVMSQLSTRLTFAMVLMVIVTAAIIEFVTFRGIEAAILPGARERIDAQVRLLATELEGYVVGARADVRSFRAAVALEGIVRALRNGGVDPVDNTSDSVWRARMAARYLAELSAKPLYLQFRIIGADNNGKELVRVDRSGPGNSVRIVPDRELQQKAGMDYMVGTTSLRDGEIYVSPINLNREHGDIDLPLSPVLRVGTPIYAKDGTLFGALIINMDMRPIFGRIRVGSASGGDLYIVNEQGDYLLHPDRSREFGWEFGRPDRIWDDHPRFASLLKTDGVWDDVFTNVKGETVLAAAARLKLSPHTSVAVIDIVPYSVIMAPVWSIGYSAFLAGLSAAIGAVFLAILIARTLTRPLRQTTAAVQAFARNEPMQLPAHAAGEIGVLVKAFERMSADMREKASELKRETDERRRIFETSLDLIIIVDRRGKLIRVSPSSMMILGYLPEEMIGHSAAEFLYPEDLENTRREMRLSRRGRLMRNFETRYVHKDGRAVTLAWTGVWSEPEQQHFFIGRDVTEQNLVGELFRLAVEACPSGMMMTDHGGRIVMVNSEIENLFGYQRDELLNQSIEMLVPQNLRMGHEKLRAEFTMRPISRKMGKGRELQGLRKDGSEFPLEIDINTIQIRDGLLVLAVVVDISERKRTAQLKDEFVSTVSHELRTPLTSVTASLALLSKGMAGPLSESALRLVSIAHSNSQRLVRLINDILDIEKMDSGKMLFNFEKVNTRAIVEQAIETVRAYADELGVNVRLDAMSVSGEVRADSDRLTQVVSNLLSNAIKFSPCGADVTVGIEHRDDAIRIAVRDHGPGIPDDFKSRIFGKFAQADASDTRRKGGTGLGLSIVKEIVTRMGGLVGFESTLGHGALFFVQLPCWRSGIDDQPANIESGVKIMLCEDDPEVAVALSAKLAQAGFETHVAATVNDALLQADDASYAVVLVDLNLPDGDGIGLIQKLRDRPRYHDKPIVVISANPKRGQDDSRSITLGILDWLAKPVDLVRLLQLLEGAIVRDRTGDDGNAGQTAGQSNTREVA